MYHTKLIERCSRCTKDPNPLASTMILLNQKYPISLSKPEIKKYGVPSVLLSKGRDHMDIEDSHMHNRVLARLSTIDWWIQHSTIPSEEMIRLSDVLFMNSDKLVSDFYNVDWSSTRVKWGQPMLQRNLVRTQQPIVDIPANLRCAAIKEVFFPDYTIPNPALSTAIVKELMEKIGMRLEDNMPLTKQVRIILNALDPRERYLPVLPTCGESSVQMKHALVHNNLAVTNYMKSATEDTREWIGPFKNLLTCIIFEGKTAQISVDELRGICLSSSIGDIGFETMLSMVSVSDSIEFLWAKALFDKVATLEYKVGNMVICPDPREGREVVIYNKKNISRVMKMGNQVVNFKYNDMRGKYVYNGQTLIEIVSNFTSIREFTSLLKEIAKMIHYRYQDTKDIKSAMNDRQIEKFVDNAPYKFISCKLQEFSKISTLKEGENCGKYRYQPNSEYMNTGSYHVTLDENLNILLPGTSLKITVNANKSKALPFSSDVSCWNHRMLNFFNVKETIKEMYYFYMKNMSSLLDKIKENDFTWKNIYVRKFLGGSARQMSMMARTLVTRLVCSETHNPHYISFLYCFCGTQPLSMDIGPLSYCLPDGTIIDMAAEKGIFVYNDNLKSYMLYGMKVARNLRKVEKAELLRGVLEGYKIIYPAIEGLRIVSVRSLESSESKIEEGEMRNTYIGGTLYTVKKDSSVMYSTRATLSRHVEEVIRRVEKQGKVVILGKRWLECEEFDSEHLSPEKKMKKMKEEEVTLEYSDDVVVGCSGLDDDL